MKLAATGHRCNKLGYEYNYDGPVTKCIAEQVQTYFQIYKPEEVIVGMAIGFDTIVAKVCVAMKIPFIAAIPFVGQEIKWPSKAQKLYYELLSKAKSIQVVNLNRNVTYNQWKDLSDGTYNDKVMQKRNVWMVDQLHPSKDRLLACFDGSNGGTSNCILYAQSTHKIIDYINLKLCVSQ